jgi:hypothetical protein
MDVVVEFPILPSFPTPGAPERLYLADSVAFAIEVKSDLSKQWPEVVEKARALSPLRREWHGHLQMTSAGMKEHPASDSRIPFVAVGFAGFANPEGLRNRLESTEFDDRPDTALVIESGAYASRVRGTTQSGSGTRGLFALCVDGAYYARNVITANPDLRAYFAILDASEREPN